MSNESGKAARGNRKERKISLNQIQQLCKEINMPREAEEAVLGIAVQVDKKELQASVGKLLNRETWEEGRKEIKQELGKDTRGFGMLYCMLQGAVISGEHYREKGISHEIYIETMKCFSRFVREYQESFGRYGFDRDFWTTRQLSGLLYRIGELEYELLTQEGRRGVAIHIPSDALLEKEALSQSFQEAGIFLKEKYPAYSEAAMTCRSWLLSPALKQLLPSGSRILTFQDFFTIRETGEEEQGFMNWVFKRDDLPLEELPENTSLQKNLKKYLLEGGTVREASGVLKQMTGSGEHKRRPRYNGTHPRRFEEKYKELNPEKYQDTIERVIQKGSTPAGMHLSICVKEILDFLQIKPGMTGLDATLGYGGHSRKMLECLEGKGHLYGLDVDPIEIEKTKKRLKDAGYGEEIFTAISENFANIDAVAKTYGPFQFLLADLGVSSMQIDNPERGFSYKTDGPLDLRLNPLQGIPAAQRLKEASREELTGMLIENADEPYAEEIGRKIAAELRKGRPIETTKRLAEVVAQALSFLPEKEQEEAVKKSCARVFQALRIDVNSEFEVLEAFLEKLPSVMVSGGRIAVLTFHSGEDRLVKKSFKALQKAGIYSEVATEVIRPSKEECVRNPRARSTKMRWAVRA